LVFLAGMAAKGAGHAEVLGDEHLQVAKVVELLHTATLVHDDVLDGGRIRRRLPTVNAMSGVEVAVLLGDYLYAKAFHMAVQLDDPACARWLAETVRVICQGEITQILHRFDFAWTEERYFQVIADKTASLYAAACRLGAHYAGADGTRCRMLEEFGLELGIAFQIVDDCLDLDGDETVVGKSLGTDLQKGKLTLPLLWLVGRDPAAGERLRQLMDGDPGLSLRRLKVAFPLGEATAYALEEAERRVRKAQGLLASLPDGPAREALVQLASFVVARRA
jgi:octaprenyl-diphosphate synthase